MTHEDPPPAEPAAAPLAWTLVQAGDEDPSNRLLVLHGIFGRGRNWTTLARDLCTARPDWAAVLVDLRLHGDSPAYGPPHTVASAATDLIALERHAGLRASAVMGHSFGGKVALQHAASGHDRLAQAWIVDATPDARMPAGSAWRMIETVRRMPPDFAARAEAVHALTDAGYALGTASWMASNLVHRDGRYRWRLDFDAMEALLGSYFSTDLWGIVENPPSGLTLHVVKATESSALSDEACARIEAAGARNGQVVLHYVQGGHWLHVENPRALLALLADHLPRGRA